MSIAQEFLEEAEFLVHIRRRHHHKCGVKLQFGPFSTGDITIMSGSISAPPGATGTAVLKAQPDGASFTGAPKIVSSDTNVVSVSDNGSGQATLTVNPSATDGATCTITGSDDAFKDDWGFTVSAAAAPTPTTETGVALSITFP